MARKKDERVVKQAYKEERKAKAAQKKTANGHSSEPYLQANDEHFVSFKNQLSTMGLMLRDIPGDGNCLFRALDDQLEGHSRNHLDLRRATVRFMVEHRADFEPFVEDDVPFQTHVRLLSQPGTYGGHDALVAFARMNKMNIVIHQINSPLWQIEGGPLGCQQLHLSYHNGEHYSSVRRAGDTTESPADIRINITNTVENGPRKDANKMNPSSGYSSCHEEANGGGMYGNDDDLVQKIAKRTGCKDLSMIVETLVEYDGDEQNATDFIMNLMVVTENCDPNTADAIAEPENGASACAAGMAAGETVQSPAGGRTKPKTPAKKLTNKQRKQQNRLEKLARSRKDADQKTSPDEQPVGQEVDAIIVESAFGCLRI